MEKMYVFGHSYGDAFSNEYDKTIAIYKSEDDAKAHLAVIFDELTKYQDAGKCCEVESADNYVGCSDLVRNDDGCVMQFDYDRWYYIEVPVMDTMPDKIGLF